MNKDKVIHLCHKISTKKNIPFNSVLIYYFLEDILSILSNSKYNDKFIYKGGYLLSNVIGISERTTVDIDLLVRNFNLEPELIQEVFEEILSNNSTSRVKYKIHDIAVIKNENEYGGYRIRVECKLDNIRQIIPLDVSTGDIITYEPIEYQYKPLFTDEIINILAYNLETILAEKIETIYSRVFLNSRMKDYYDIYIISKLKYNDLNLSKLKDACERTFNQRNTNLNFEDIDGVMSLLKEDSILNNRWHTFLKSNKYLDSIKFEVVIDEIKTLIRRLKNIKT